MNHPEPSATKPDAASRRPRTWYPCLDESGQDLVTPEIRDVIVFQDGREVPRFERQVRAGELKAILRRASRGDLRDGSWKPVSREPKLWELRWKWDDGSQLRGYFHEPALEPDSTVLAKVHRKEIIEQDDRATRGLQDAQIDDAGIRMRRCQAHSWGLGQSKPLA